VRITASASPDLFCLQPVQFPAEFSISALAAADCFAGMKVQ